MHICALHYYVLPRFEVIVHPRCYPTIVPFNNNIVSRELYLERIAESIASDLPARRYSCRRNVSIRGQVLSRSQSCVQRNTGVNVLCWQVDSRGTAEAEADAGAVSNVHTITADSA